MFSLHYLLRAMLAEKRKLFLTILAIAWATASIACMLAIGEGLRATYGKAVAATGNSLLIIEGGQTSSAYHGQALNKAITLNFTDFKIFKDAIPNITITPEYSLNVRIIYRPLNKPELTFANQVSAVEPLFASIRNITLQPGGRFIDELDNQERRPVIVLGNEVATILFGNTEPIGKTVYVEDKPFQVIGVTGPKLQLATYTTLDNYGAWIPLNTYKVLANPQSINYILIVPHESISMVALKQQIRTLYSHANQLDPADENILVFQDNQKTQQQTQQIFNGMKWFLGIVGVLTLIVAGVGISNVMLISVKRATKEIGIRMAIGARTEQILVYYLFEAFITTALGGALGILIAKGVVSLLGLIPYNSPLFKFIPKPEALLSWQIILTVIFILSIVGLIAGLLPARKATQILPAEALRHE
jgi:putative ABC transport system permease protein